MSNSYTKPVLFFDDNTEEFLGKDIFLNNIVECVPISKERYNFFDNNPNDPNHINNSNLPYYFLYNNYFSENKYVDNSIMKFLYYFQKTENDPVIDESVWTELKKDIEGINTHFNIFSFLFRNLFTINISYTLPTDKDLFKNDAKQYYDILFRYFLLLQSIRPFLSEGYNDYNIVENIKNILNNINIIIKNITDLEHATMGLTREQMDKIVHWSENFPDKKTIVFDWDNTMIVLGGFDASKWNDQQYIQFIFGGPPRLERIKQLFKTLRENNVDIYILTRNKAASEKREEFLKIIHTYLDEDFSEKNLIYAKDYRKSAKISFLQTKFIDCTIKKLQGLQELQQTKAL